MLFKQTSSLFTMTTPIMVMTATRFSKVAFSFLNP